MTPPVTSYPLLLGFILALFVLSLLVQIGVVG